MMLPLLRTAPALLTILLFAAGCSDSMMGDDPYAKEVHSNGGGFSVTTDASNAEYGGPEHMTVQELNIRRQRPEVTIGGEGAAMGANLPDPASTPLVLPSRRPQTPGRQMESIVPPGRDPNSTAPLTEGELQWVASQKSLNDFRERHDPQLQERRAAEAIDARMLRNAPTLPSAGTGTAAPAAGAAGLTPTTAPRN